MGTSVQRLAVGIGSEAKQRVALLLVGLALGFLLNGQRRMFASRWLWAGAAIAFIGVAPNLIWEAAHSSPTLTMDAQMHAEHSGLDDAVKFPFIVLLVAGLLISPEQVVDGTRGFFRQLPIRRLLWRSRRVAAGIVALNAVLFLPLGLPVLPPTVVGTLDLNKINDNLGEEIGWYEVVDQVIAVWKSLPSDVRQHAAVLTQNYGEAGALIQFHGDASPEVFSGHNSFWSWGVTCSITLPSTDECTSHQAHRWWSTRIERERQLWRAEKDEAPAEAGARRCAVLRSRPDHGWLGTLTGGVDTGAVGTGGALTGDVLTGGSVTGGVSTGGVPIGGVPTGGAPDAAGGAAPTESC